MKYKRLIIVAVVAFLAVIAVRAEDSSPQELLDDLQRKLDRLHTLAGRFTQSLESRSLGRPRRERGGFAIRRPSSMRWEYDEPEEKLAIINGTETLLYLPEDGEVHRGRLPESGGGAAASLLGGRFRLNADFTSKRLAAGEAAFPGEEPAGTVNIELVPRTPSEEFERLVLAADPDALLIRRLIVFDSLGGWMAFDFHDLVENRALPDGLFDFEIPEGVTVIDDR